MKQMISLFLAILILACSVISASAVSPQLAGSGKTVVEYGDWILEKINNDTQWELDEYIGTAADVNAPRIIDDMLVVSFGSHCFANNTNVKSVITSSPLWTIGEYAFIDCTLLESIELHYALHTIGVGAFSGTSSLKDINLEDSAVTTINAYTFLNSGIEEVALPTTCTSIKNNAFAQCYELKKITIPKSVTEIDETAFKFSENAVIYCYTDSYAHTYAQENDIDFVLIDAENPTDAPTDEPTTAPITSYVRGDADHDGKVTIIDATKIQRFLAKLVDDPDGYIRLAGDVDGDGLNIIDATRIQRYLARIENPYNIGEIVTVEE